MTASRTRERALSPGAARLWALAGFALVGCAGGGEGIPDARVLRGDTAEHSTAPDRGGAVPYEGPRCEKGPTVCQGHGSHSRPCDLVDLPHGTPCAWDDEEITGLCVAGRCMEPIDACTQPDSPCLMAVFCDGLKPWELVPVREGAPCEDGVACTVEERCEQGVCTPGRLLECPDSYSCSEEICVPEEGCTFVPVDCEDGDPCTSDHCDPFDGQCQHTLVKWCDDQNPCTIDSCDPSDESCVHVPVLCEDGDPCTEGRCERRSGDCVQLAAGDCDDADPCTDDRCVAFEGCQHTPNEGPCEDGDRCTVGDRCEDGECLPGSPHECEDENRCTWDYCVPFAGCRHKPLSGEWCKDGGPCTSSSRCTAGVCPPGEPRDCDDGHECTADRCDPVEGCEHTPEDALCDDGDQCTSDRCERWKGCTHRYRSGWGVVSSCDDGDPCTTDDWCRSFKGARLGCMGERVSCPDDDPCTPTACHHETGECEPVWGEGSPVFLGFEGAGSVLAPERGDVSAVLAEGGYVYAGMRDGPERMGGVTVYEVGEAGSLSALKHVALGGGVSALAMADDILLAAGGWWQGRSGVDAASGACAGSRGRVWALDVADPGSPQILEQLDAGEMIVDAALTDWGQSLFVLDAGGRVYAMGVWRGGGPDEESIWLRGEDPVKLPRGRSLDSFGDIVAVGSDRGSLAVLRSGFGGLSVEHVSVALDAPFLVERTGSGLLAISPGRIAQELDLSGPVATLVETPLGEPFVVDLAPAGEVWIAARGPAGGIATFSDAGGSPAGLLGTAPSPGSAEAVAAWGSWAFLADGEQGLRVYDISDPARPVEVGAAHDGGRAHAMDLVGDKVYLAEGRAGLAVIDAEDPDNPAVEGRLAGDLDARDVAVQGDVAFLADARRGLVAADVSEPGSPVVVGELDPGGRLLGLGIAGDHLYATLDAAFEPGLGGALVASIDISDPRAPRLEELLPVQASPGDLLAARVEGASFLALGREGSRLRLLRAAGGVLSASVLGAGGQPSELAPGQRVSGWHLDGHRLVAALRPPDEPSCDLWLHALGRSPEPSVAWAGIAVYDMEDASAPVLTHTLDGFRDVSSFSLVGDTLLIASRGLSAYRLGRRGGPEGLAATYLASHRVRSGVQDLVFRDGLVYLVEARGLHVVRASFCEDCAGGGGECDPGSSCGAARCIPGAGCVVEPAAGACDDGDPCTADRCDPKAPEAGAGGCVHEPLPDGSDCSDGDLCNGAERCDGGLCRAPGGVEEDPERRCPTETCDPASGAVIPRWLPCDDGEPCTLDSCDPAEGCRYERVADAVGCDDGDPCNGVERCERGSCTAGEPLSCPEGSPCGPFECVPYLGCASPACDDGDPCTRDLCGEEGCDSLPEESPGCVAGCVPEAVHLRMPEIGGAPTRLAAFERSLYVVCEGCGAGRCGPGEPDALVQIRVDAASLVVAGVACLPRGHALGDLHIHGERAWLLWGLPEGAASSPALLSFDLDPSGRPGAPVVHPVPENAGELVAHREALALGLGDGRPNASRDRIGQSGSLSPLRGAHLLLLGAGGDPGRRLDLPGSQSIRSLLGVHSAGRYVFVSTGRWPGLDTLSVVDLEAPGGARTTGAVAYRDPRPIASDGSVLLFAAKRYALGPEEDWRKVLRVDVADPAAPSVLTGSLAVRWSSPHVSGGLLLGLPGPSGEARPGVLYRLEGAELPVELGPLELPSGISEAAFGLPFVHLVAGGALRSLELRCREGEGP